MKVNTTKEKITNAVLIADRIVGKKESLPVLSCVLLEAGNDLMIRATNLEAGVEIHVPCIVEERGVVAVPASVLSQTIRSIKSDALSLHIDDANLLIESRNTKTLIKSLVADEFPHFGQDTISGGISVSRSGLVEMVQSVVYAASVSMIRPELGSVHLSVKEGVMASVATDSFRLAERSIHNVAASEMKNILIPLKHALELVYILERTTVESVSISSDDSQLVVVADDIRYVSRVVDAVFPNYKEIIPTKSTTEAIVLKVDFAEMLHKARVFSGADQHVGLHVYPSRRIFSATAQNSNVGEMSDAIDATLSGDDLDIKFHIGYLGDCLSSIKSDSITLGFSGPGRALVIRGVSDQDFLYLVMPLNR